MQLVAPDRLHERGHELGAPRELHVDACPGLLGLVAPGYETVVGDREPHRHDHHETAHDPRAHEHPALRPRDLFRPEDTEHAVNVTVLGVDACTRGWVGVVLRPDGSTAAVLDRTLPRLARQLAGSPDAPELVAVDIPIGLPRCGHRPADVAARGVLGPRRSSVFHTPVRESLLAPTHAEATAASVRLTGRGISRQAYALRKSIFDAEAFLDVATCPVVEAHPEVSFTVLLGHPPQASKKSWAGVHERLAALRHGGVRLDDLGAVGQQAGPDDVLDAAVVAWSARRVLAGAARSFPESAPRDPDTGRLVAIWA